MGLGKNGYYNLTDLHKVGAKINWIISERGDGKSYAVKEKALKRAYENQAPTIAIIRRNDVDCKPTKIENYFVERDEKANIVSKVTKGEYDHIKARAGFIYLAKWENGKEVKSNYAVGEYFALSTSIHEKSTGHKCEDIICEEMLTDGIYLDDEPSKFMQLLSTIVRSDDENVMIYLLGNTINRVCPYFKEWGMTNIFKQEQGTIDIYQYEQLDGTKIKIACERVKSRNVKSRLFIGKAEKSIQGGEWEVHEYPKLYQPLEDFDEIFTVTYKASNGLNFTIRLIMNEEGSKFCFVHYAKHISERVLTTEFSINPMHTPFLRRDRKIDIDIHNCFINNKFMYSDNLTATDFNNCLKSEKHNPLL